MSYKRILVTLLVLFLLSCSSKSNSGDDSYYTDENSSSTIGKENSDEEINESEDENEENEEEVDSDTYFNSDESDDNDSEDRYPDDIYCAEVDYYNPNTGTSSSYTLTVEVEDNEVIKIDFPRGWLDVDHFDAAELDEDGTTSFTSDKGYEYELRIIGKEAGCFTNVPRAVQCRGITEDGEQCEHLTDNLNGLCWMHQYQD